MPSDVLSSSYPILLLLLLPQTLKRCVLAGDGWGSGNVAETEDAEKLHCHIFIYFHVHIFIYVCPQCQHLNTVSFKHCFMKDGVSFLEVQVLMHDLCKTPEVILNQFCRMSFYAWPENRRSGTRKHPWIKGLDECQICGNDGQRGAYTTFHVINHGGPPGWGRRGNNITEMKQQRRWKMEKWGSGGKRGGLESHK